MYRVWKHQLTGLLTLILKLQGASRPCLMINDGQEVGAWVWKKNRSDRAELLS